MKIKKKWQSYSKPKKVDIILSLLFLLSILLIIILTIFCGFKIFEKTKETNVPEIETTIPQKEEEEDIKKINAEIFTNSYENFESDNLNFRGDENLISYKGRLMNYDIYSDNAIYYPIIFVGEKAKVDFNIKSGDILSFYSTEYTVIDNQSNCNDYTDNYCVEILSEKQFKDFQTIEKEV